jgi:hypothetical protein
MNSLIFGGQMTVETVPASLSFSGPVVHTKKWFLRRRFLNDPTLFLHFCDYLPFEEDLTLYLNKLKIPLPKDDLYPV